MDEQVIQKQSAAYGYNYASLSDIAKQGIKIPKMKTGTEENKEYVYCYDEELKEWLRGAEIVIPPSPINKDGKPKMNEAQLYGSALTYARRYSVQLILGLACDEDKELEAQEPKVYEPKPQNKAKPVGGITTAQFKKLLDKHGNVYMGQYLKSKGYEKGSQISIEEFNSLMNMEKQ